MLVVAERSDQLHGVKKQGSGEILQREGVPGQIPRPPVVVLVVTALQRVEAIWCRSREERMSVQRGTPPLFLAVLVPPVVALVVTV